MENKQSAEENSRLLKLAEERLELLEASLHREVEANKALMIELKKARDKEREYHDAKEEMTVLHGLLPICSHCKKIRADDGYWNELDALRTEARAMPGASLAQSATSHEEASGGD